MTRTLVHRGPDSAGLFVEDEVALGFRRLAIVDPEGGDQPLYNEDEALVLTCAGEIYNAPELRSGLERKGHSFRTFSDAEVLLHLYEEVGTDLVHELNGQFAFALYDRREKQLFLARDHFGVTPLHYAVSDGFFLYGSEIKSILEHPAAPRRVDLTALDQVFSFPGIVSPRTIFRGISSLPPGHQIVVADGQVETSEYWDLEYPPTGDSEPVRSVEHYRDELGEALERAVRYRLRADVPIGLYLSGGLDSSLITALVRDACSTATPSFSIGFEDPSICERAYQRLVAERFGTEHHEIRFGWEDIAERLSGMVYHCEFPVKETFNTCSLALSESARSHGVKVVLGGEGADELFAGYPGYRFDRTGLRQARTGTLEEMLEDQIRERLWGDPQLFYEKDQHAFRDSKLALYSVRLRERFPEFDCLEFPVINPERIAGRHAVHQRSYLDLKLRLADHLLSEHGDRMLLAHSVEGRYPFLDIGVVEAARWIPPELKLHDLEEKFIVKEVARALLPDEILEREKFGFRAPGSSFLLRQQIEWIDDLLSRERLERQGYFDPDTVETLRRRAMNERYDLNPHLETDFLMVVLTFGLLCDHYRLPSLGR